MSIEAQSALIKHAKGGIRVGGSTVSNNPKRADPQADNPGNGPAAAQAVTNSTGAADQALFESDIMRLQSMGFDDDLIMSIARTGIPIYNLTIASPADGFVVERNALPKQKMSPDTLYTIADLSTVYVTADIPEYLGSVVRIGQPAALMLPSLSGKKIKGTIESILPVADPVSHTLKLRMVIANPDYALKVGMYGDLEIQSGSLKRLTVPREAILDSGLKRIVFVDRGDGNLESKEVSTGQNFGNRVEVLGGLKAGDRIVTSGNFLIDSESQLKASRGSRNQ
jgi:RND family efflux transporter MFP subunit